MVVGYWSDQSYDVHYFALICVSSRVSLSSCTILYRLSGGWRWEPQWIGFATQLRSIDQSCISHCINRPVFT
jgi:hypothetical protein